MLVTQELLLFIHSLVSHATHRLMQTVVERDVEARLTSVPRDVTVRVMQHALLLRKTHTDENEDFGDE